MCSVGDDFENAGSEYMPSKPFINTIGSKCTKCTAGTPVIILHHKNPYCETCFLAVTVHKFKAILGKYRLVRPGANVLVVYEGGDASTALLHFLRTGLDVTTPKKLRFNPIVCYIEDTYNLQLAERKRLMQQIGAELDKFKFVTYFVSFAQFIANQSLSLEQMVNNVNALPLNENDCACVNNAIEASNRNNKTNKIDILSNFRRKLLISVAEHLQCPAIFTPELAVGTASQLLANLALGRGTHIPFDTGIVDARHPNVKIMRPLRMFTIEELAFYNSIHNLVALKISHVEEHAEPGIQDLMAKFVSNLQTNYPATVSTIVRTGDKLVFTETDQLRNKCKYCAVPIEDVPDELTAEEATNFSHWISCNVGNCTNIETFKNSTRYDCCFACSKIRS